MHYKKVIVLSEWTGKDYGGGEDVAVFVSQNPIDMNHIEKVIADSCVSGEENGIPSSVSFEVVLTEDISSSELQKMQSLEHGDWLYEINLDSNESWIHQTIPDRGRYPYKPQFWYASNPQWKELQ